MRVLNRGICTSLVALMGIIVGCTNPSIDGTVLEESARAKLEQRETLAMVDDSSRYLKLMKLSLTDLVYENSEDARKAQRDGSEWPSRAYTMIGIERLNNIQECVEDVLANDVPGDFLEAGAWRGGATIFMRALLDAYDVEDRTVWVADSFEGLPPPDLDNYPADSDWHVNRLHEVEVLAVSQEEVERNFGRYGLLDGQVKFLKGWFSDTLPTAPIEQLAVLRIDADMYESTTDALVNLYDKLSPGGYVILDDYLLIPACQQAVDDYRAKNGITDPIQKADWNAVYWKKS